MAIPPQAVIPLATGELEEYKVGWKEKDHYMDRLDGIKALSNLAGTMAIEGHKILLDCLMDDDPKIEQLAFRSSISRRIKAKRVV